MSEPIAFQPPLSRVNVINRRASDVALILILLIFGGLSAVMLLSSHINNARYLLVPLMLFLLGIISFVVLRARRNSVRFFDTDGITRGDGRHFPWSEFQGVVKRWGSTRFGGRSIWRYELSFARGRAWVLPAKLKNAREVLDVINSLPELR